MRLIVSLVSQQITGELLDVPIQRLPICRLVSLQMPPLTVAVNMSKITNALKPLVGFGFRVGLLIFIFVFIC